MIEYLARMLSFCFYPNPFIKQTRLISCSKHTVLVIASIIPIPDEKFWIKFTICLSPYTEQTAAENFRSKYCTPIFKNGFKKRANNAKIPYIPAVFFITEALIKIVSDASAKTPPITGIIPEIAILVAFKAE